MAVVKTTYNAEQRRLLYRAMRDMIDRAERDDPLISSRNIRPDGYSGISNGFGGGGHTGHSDPTGSVVVRIEAGEAVGTLAQQWFGHLHMAAKELELADSKRAGLLPPVERFSEEEWCRSCLRVTLTDHKGRKRKLCSPIFRDGPLCHWCGSWERDYGQWPPIDVLTDRAEGKRIYRPKEEAS